MDFEMNLYLNLRCSFIEDCFVPRVDHFYHLSKKPMGFQCHTCIGLDPHSHSYTNKTPEGLPSGRVKSCVVGKREDKNPRSFPNFTKLLVSLVQVLGVRTSFPVEMLKLISFSCALVDKPSLRPL
jgi:hypothetical protein